MCILIHTSVKLVTIARLHASESVDILIHTSVKLVTHDFLSGASKRGNFNPHEREARDAGHEGTAPLRAYFNPHEREARDMLVSSLNSFAVQF